MNLNKELNEVSGILFQAMSDAFENLIFNNAAQDMFNKNVTLLDSRRII